MRSREVDVDAYREELRALHTLTFPDDVQPDWLARGRAWVTFVKGQAVAFLYAAPQEDGVWYFARVGVLVGYRGHGLQGKLMAMMEKALRGNVIISSTYYNIPSANNFVRRGWLMYQPAYPWAAENTLYWYKEVP